MDPPPPPANLRNGGDGEVWQVEGGGAAAAAAAAAVEGVGPAVAAPPPLDPGVVQDDDGEEEHRDGGGGGREQGGGMDVDDEDDEEDDDDDEEDEEVVRQPDGFAEAAEHLLIEGGHAEPEPPEADPPADDDHPPPPRIAANADITLFLTCADDSLLRKHPDHPVLQPHATVQIGMGKTTKLLAVFQRYVQVCNDRKPPSLPPLEVEDLEFVHSHVLQGSDTAEAAALMKNDLLTVRANQEEVRRRQKERDRIQRESDRHFLELMRTEVPRCRPDVVLVCLGRIPCTWNDAPPALPAEVSAAPAPAAGEGGGGGGGGDDDTGVDPMQLHRPDTPPTPRAKNPLPDRVDGQNPDADVNREVPCHSFLLLRRCPWFREHLLLAARTGAADDVGGRRSSSGGSPPQDPAPSWIEPGSASGDPRPEQQPPPPPPLPRSSSAAAAAAVVPADAALDGEVEGQGATDGAGCAVKHPRPDGGRAAAATQIESDDTEVPPRPCRRPSSVEPTADRSRRGTPLRVPLDYPVEAVRMLVEYVYTNRVVALGLDAFAAACKTKPTHHSGPVMPLASGSRRRWPNRGEPTATFAAAAATLDLADRAGLPRLALMAEVAAAQRVATTQVVHALSLCEQIRAGTGSDLPRLRRACLELVLRSQSHEGRAVWVLPSFRRELQNRRKWLVPALLTGTKEALEAAAATAAAATSTPKGSGTAVLQPPPRAFLQHDPVEWRANLAKHFRTVDKYDAALREEERRRRMLPDPAAAKKAAKRKKQKRGDESTAAAAAAASKAPPAKKSRPTRKRFADDAAEALADARSARQPDPRFDPDAGLARPTRTRFVAEVAFGGKSNCQPDNRRSRQG